ncbi:DGQHR domain-containing protein [Aeromonas enteropelogenes]|uniref:DGQHR domain-containing protein n=1 Tax=Aeromonas enteropelogenes TaxID=29489 RepID=UPI00191DA3AD|nr:DGQHR domain-containing protein [Aeromonas enteropelogenes]MBL0521091.1 DGQHR domain-containing protein [Aeromonas enteropelogenes]
MIKKIPVIEIVQPLGIFYVASLTAGELLKLTYPSRMRETNKLLDLHKKTDIPGDFFSIIGTQRKLDTSKQKSVEDYIKTGYSCFPNSIIIGANISQSGLDIDDNSLDDESWYIEDFDFDLPDGGKYNQKFLVIPDDSQKVASIIDGQHRLEGFVGFDEDAPERKIPLLCSIFIGLPASYQAHIFATINTTQKRVSKNDVYQLYQFNMQESEPRQWAPDTLAVYISRVINGDRSSNYYGCLRLGASNLSYSDSEWSISLAAVTTGILKLISSNPKLDREKINILSGEKLSRRDLESDEDKSPLREWYIGGQDKDLYDLVTHFLDKAYHKYLKDKESVFRKTIGMQALFDVLYLIVSNSKLSKLDDIVALVDRLFEISPDETEFKKYVTSLSTKTRGLIKSLLIENAVRKDVQFSSIRIKMTEENRGKIDLVLDGK